MNGVKLMEKEGEKKEVVGEYGDGKQKIIRIVKRLYEIERGRIILDGKDIEGVKKKQMSKEIEYVQKKKYMFEGKIEDNIRYGSNEERDEEIIEEEKIENENELIMKKKKGYEKKVGEKGVKI